VLDGEVLVAQTGPDGALVRATATTSLGEAGLPPVALAPFAALQRRLGRKAPGKALLASHPAVFIAFDLLELDGNDWRERPLAERRTAMAGLLAAHARSNPQPRLLAAPALTCTDWAGAGRLRAAARDIGAEGLMLKHAASPYGGGRTRGDWWKWKLDPHSVDAVLVYAQAGHGRRAGLFTDYTFAVWHEGALVPFAKAYSGLSDAEIREVDRFVRRNTLETFGPVRQLRAELVFEIGFEGILPSRRHKAGVAVRFPRMLRWRQDKPAAEAGTLAELVALAAAQGGTADPQG
jgi:DNA ligase-1